MSSINVGDTVRLKKERCNSDSLMFINPDSEYLVVDKKCGVMGGYLKLERKATPWEVSVGLCHLFREDAFELAPKLKDNTVLVSDQRMEEVTCWVEKNPRQAALEILNLRSRVEGGE